MRRTSSDSEVCGEIVVSPDCLDAATPHTDWEARQERVRRLTRLVSAGEYFVSAREVADKIVDSMLPTHPNGARKAPPRRRDV